MDKQDIKLTDGRVIEIQVSFLTLYLIKNNNLDKETKALKRMTDKYEKMDDKSSVAAKKLHEKIEDKQFYMAAKNDLCKFYVLIVKRLNLKMHWHYAQLNQMRL